MGLSVASGGEFLSSVAKSMPLCGVRKLLFPPNNSSRVCIEPPLLTLDCESCRPHESRFVKSKWFMLLLGDETESDGEGSAKDMYVGSLARMLNEPCFPNPKSRFMASSVAVEGVSSSALRTAGSKGISDPKLNSELFGARNRECGEETELKLVEPAGEAVNGEP